MEVHFHGNFWSNLRNAKIKFYFQQTHHCIQKSDWRYGELKCSNGLRNCHFFEWNYWSTRFLWIYSTSLVIARALDLCKTFSATWLFVFRWYWGANIEMVRLGVFRHKIRTFNCSILCRHKPFDNLTIDELKGIDGHSYFRFMNGKVFPKLRKLQQEIRLQVRLAFLFL